MGYALFASRKIYYTNLINTLNQQLDDIMQQRQSVLDFSANIADGVVTVDEMASDATNYNNYQEYLYGADQYINTPDDEGGSATTTNSIGQMAAEQNNNEAYLQSVANMLNKSVNQKYAQQYQKKLEAYENELDMKQKKLETKIAAAEKELEAVEQAEGKAIDRATPKYDGVQ